MYNWYYIISEWNEIKWKSCNNNSKKSLMIQLHTTYKNNVLWYNEYAYLDTK
jgi:hypothetical protein